MHASKQNFFNDFALTHLGGRSLRKGHHPFTPGNLPYILMDDVACDGSEASLTKCGYSSTAECRPVTDRCDCDLTEAAGVQCDPPGKYLLNILISPLAH